MVVIFFFISMALPALRDLNFNELFDFNENKMEKIAERST
jgi:hypothetical protein